MNGSAAKLCGRRGRGKRPGRPLAQMPV